MLNTEFLNKIFTKQIYSRYISENNGIYKKNFVDREITSLFVDIQAFSSIDHELDPIEMVKDLDKYLCIVINIINKNIGIIENTIGDAVIAIFGEDANLDHPDQACTAAIEIIKMIHEFNNDRINKPKLTLGIGINTGYATMGIFGNKFHYQFKVIGGSVNLASRTQGLTSYYKKEILVTNNTTLRLKKEYNLIFIEKVLVKGMADGLEIYELKT